MPILYAEIQVLGRQVPCARVSFSFRQAIDEKDRPSSIVRVELLKVVLVGEPAGWGIWEELKFDDFRRVSGRMLFFEGEGQTARRYTFYDAALVWLEFRYDGKGTAGQQPATQVELHFSPATVEVDGQRIEAHSIIPWETDPQTSFRALTKPPDPLPSAHLAALLATIKLKAEELGTGLLQKVITPAGEVATEFLSVGLAAIARTASLTVGLVLTPTNSPDDPGYASEWELYRRNHQGTPLTPAQLRLAQLERLHEQGDLTADEEAEMIALLASVKGIHVQDLSELSRASKANSYRKGPTKKSASSNPGRSGKQARLRELAKDDKLGSADRGWLNQEINSIQRKSKRQGRDGTLRPQKNIRNPPGKDLAHRRGERASKGFSYKTAVLQDVDLHHLEHKHEGYK